MRRLLLCAALALPTLACSPSYMAVELEAVSNPPVGVTTTIRDDEVEIPVGVVMAVKVTPLSDNATPYERSDRVRLRGKDTSILDVEPTEDERVFVLIGVSPGNTCIEVEINGSNKDCIDASVTLE